MANLTDFNRLIRAEASGVPEPVLDEVVLRAARRFLSHTRAWKHTPETLFPWNELEEFPDLSADLPAGTAIARVEAVVDVPRQDPLVITNVRQVAQHYPDWRNRVGNTPRFVIDDGGYGNWRIVPMTEEEQLERFQITLALTVVETRTEFPDYLFEQHQDVIEAGVLYYLFRMPKRDWSDPQLASAHLQAFQQGMHSAASRVSAGNVSPKRTVTYGGI